MKATHIIPLLFIAVSAIAADTIKIQSAIIITTQESTSSHAFRDVSTETGKQVATTDGDYKLTIVPTIGDNGSILIESTFIEHASVPDAKVVKLPAVTTRSGKKATITVGALSFDFTPTIQHDDK